MNPRSHPRARLRHRLTSVIVLATVVLAVGATQLAPVAAAEPTVTIRIPDPGNAGALAVAKKDGSLDAALAKVNAKVQWTGSFPAFSPAAQALNAGSIDVASGSISSGIGALAARPSFKIFAVTAPNPETEGIVVKNGSSIKSVKDLVGKKVAVNQYGTGEYLLLQALKKNNISPDQVQRVYLGLTDAGPAFAAGQVDAWATFATFWTGALANYDARPLVTADKIGSQNYGITVVANSFYNEHPTVVRALYTYLHDASVKVKKNPAAYLNVFTDSGPTAVTGKLADLTVDYGKRAPTLEAVTAADVAAFQSVAKFFVDQKVIAGKVNIKDYVLQLDDVG